MSMAKTRARIRRQQETKKAAPISQEVVNLMHGRVPLLVPFTETEAIVAVLVGRGYGYDQIAAKLGVSRHTTLDLARRAAAKIPSDLPTQSRILAWMRRAPWQVLAPNARPDEMPPVVQYTIAPDTGYDLPKLLES